MTVPLASFTTKVLTVTGALQVGISDSTWSFPKQALLCPELLAGTICMLKCIYYLHIFYYYALIKKASTLDEESGRPTVSSKQFLMQN